MKKRLTVLLLICVMMLTACGGSLAQAEKHDAYIALSDFIEGEWFTSYLRHFTSSLGSAAGPSSDQEYFPSARVREMLEDGFDVMGAYRRHYRNARDFATRTPDLGEADALMLELAYAVERVMDLASFGEANSFAEIQELYTRFLAYHSEMLVAHDAFRDVFYPIHLDYMVVTVVKESGFVRLIPIFLGILFGLSIISCAVLMHKDKRSNASGANSNNGLPTEAEIAEIWSARRKRRWLLVLAVVSILMFPLSIVMAGYDYQVGFNFMTSTTVGQILGVTVIGSIFSTVSLLIIRTRYEDNRKRLIENVVHNMLKKNFDLIAYKPAESFDSKQLAQSMLLGWNAHEGNDYFEARYRGVKFAFSDVRLSMLITTSRGQSEVPVFTGPWMIIDTNKPVKVPVVVSEIKDKGSMDSRRCKVHMENIEFDNQFNVFTEDPHTAFYVLTPNFMENILSARERTFGRKHMCFAGSRAHVAVDTKFDFFGYRRGDENNLPALEARLQGEIDYIKDIIDELLLNERMFNPREASNRTPSGRSPFKPPRQINRAFSAILNILSIFSFASIAVLIAGPSVLPEEMEMIIGVGAVLFPVAFVWSLLWARRKLKRFIMNNQASIDDAIRELEEKE